MTGQFAAAVAVLIVADPLHLVAATVFAKDHALRFLPVNNYSIFFRKYLYCIFVQYNKDYIVPTQIMLIVINIHIYNISSI